MVVDTLTAGKYVPSLPVPPRSPVTLRDILTPLFFFQRRALIALAIPIVLSLLAASMARPSYVAEARLLILMGDEYVVRNPLSGAAPGLSIDKSEVVHAETEIINSRELAIQTLKAEGVSRVYPKLRQANVEVAAEAFQKDLKTEDVAQSNVIKLSLRNRDPKVASETLNRLIGFYMERRRQIFDQSDAGAAERLGRQLSQVDRQIAQFTAQHGFGDYEQELASVQQQRSILTQGLQTLDQQLALKRGRTGQLNRQKFFTPVDVDLQTELGRSQQVAALTENLLSLQTQRREAASEYVDGNPVVAELDSRIAKVKAELAAAPAQSVTMVRRGANPERQQIDNEQNDAEADMVGLAGSRSQLLASLNTVNQRLGELVVIGPAYRQLVRSRTLLEGEESELARQSQTAKLTNLQRAQANVRVIEAAHPPLTSHSSRMVVLLAGVMAGLVAAAGVTIISVALFDGMITPAQVERKLMMPVALTLPAIVEPPQRPLRSGLPRPAYFRREDMNVLSHFLRSLGPGPGSSLQLIGAGEGVGVTNLVVDIAVLAAQEGRKVLMLDLEPHRGHSAADVLEGRGATLQVIDGGLVQVGDSSLHVATRRGGGQVTIGEQEWTELFNLAYSHYDLVLVDAPPLSRSLLGVFAAPSAQATLAVVAAEETRASVALNLIERIGGAGGRVLAVVLNKRRYYIPKQIYQRL